MSVQHVEIPSKLGDLKINGKLEKGDKMIYAALRMRMNSATRRCFPSQSYLKKTYHIGQSRIEGAIDRLVDAGLLELCANDDHRRNEYYFPKTEFDKQFEMFTEEFLLLDMPIEVKEYYMDIQQYLYGKETGVGKCSMSNAEISRRTGWSSYLVKKNNTWLIDHGYLEEETALKKDEAGFPVITKHFNLTSLNQAALWVKAVTEQLATNTEDIEELKRDNEDLRKRIAALEKAQSLQRNHVDESKSYPL